MGNTLIELALGAKLNSGTKEAFKQIANSFRMLGTEVNKTAKELLKAGKTEAADALGHMGMAIQKIVGHSEEFSKTGKTLNKTLKDQQSVLRDTTNEVKAVQDAYKLWSNSGKATGDHLRQATKDTNQLSMGIQKLGNMMRTGGIGDARVQQWKESLDFSKIREGFKKGDLAYINGSLQAVTKTGEELIGINNQLGKSISGMVKNQSEYSKALVTGKNINENYTAAVRSLGKQFGYANEFTKIWNPTLKNVHTSLTAMRSGMIASDKSVASWARNVSRAKLVTEVLSGNLKTTASGFQIMNEKGLKAFSGLTVDAASKLGMLSKGFSQLSVKEGATSITAYGKAIDASLGKSDKFTAGIQRIASKYGVMSESFRSQYNDMKASDAMWQKHVTTLEKTGRISTETANKMRSGFNASKVSVVELSAALKRPSSQYAELSKTINRVSVATNQSTDILWKQAKALQAQKVPHNEIINSLNKQIGSYKEYTKLSTQVANTERELAKVRGTGVSSIRRATEAIFAGAKSEEQWMSLAKKRLGTLREQITSEREATASATRMQNAKHNLIGKYNEEIFATKGFATAMKTVVQRYGESSDSGRRAEQSLKRLADRYRETANQTSLFGRAVQSVSAHIKSFASYAAAASLIAGLVGGLQQGTVAIIEYDQALKDLQAITSATDREVEMMGTTIKQVASTTKFSASEVADGMKLLAQSGLSARESVQTIQAVSDLATGTLSDMGTAVDLVTTAMRVFKIDASESGRVADVFANAINRSKLTVEKLRVAFNYVGPIAEQAGMSFEEVASSMMILANSGVRASTIGTGLRQVLSKLIEPSDEFAAAVKNAGLTMDDLNPKYNSMEKIIQNLSFVVTDASDAFKFFGLRGASAVSALTASGAAGFSQMQDTVYRSGKAAEMAAKQMEGLGVKLKNMWDKTKNLAIALGEAGLTAVFHVVVDSARGLLDVLTALAGNPITSFIMQISLTTAALVLLISTINLLKVSSLGKWFLGTATSAGALTTSITAATASIRAFLVSIGPVGWTVIGLTLAIWGSVRALDKWKNSALDAYKAHANMADELQTISTNIQTYSEAVSTMTKGTSEYRRENLKIKTDLDTVAKRTDTIGVAAREAALSINSLTGELYDSGAALQKYKEIVDNTRRSEIQLANTKIDEHFNKVTGIVNTSYAFMKDTVSNTIDSMKARFKDFSSQSLRMLNPSTAATTLLTDGLRKTLAETEKLGPAFADMKSGKISFDEFYQILIDSKTAATDLGKELLTVTANAQSAAKVSLEELFQTKEIDIRMNDSEVVAVAKELGYLTDETEVVESALVQMFRNMQKNMHETIVGLAPAWASELGTIRTQFDTFTKGLTSNDQEMVDATKNLNKETINSFLERKAILAEEMQEKQKWFNSGVIGWKELLDAQKHYNGEAKKLTTEMGQSEDMSRFNQLIKAQQTKADSLAKLAAREGILTEQSYWQQKLDISTTYSAAIKKIMGTVYDPKELKISLQEYAETEETALKEHLAVLEKEYLIGGMGEQEYLQRQVDLTLSTYKRIEEEAKLHYQRLQAQGGIDPKDMEAAYKRYQDASQKYLAAEISSLEKVNTIRDKAQEKLTEYGDKRTEEQEKHAEKILSIETSLAQKISDINQSLSTKLTELIEKRTEIQKKAAADIEDSQNSLDDKIRGITQRGMTARQKEYDNARWAAEKYQKGLEALQRAQATGDKAQLEQAKKYLEQSSGIYGNLEDSKKAISGLKQVEAAMEQAIKTGENIDVAAVNKDIAQAKTSADYKLRRAQSLATFNLEQEARRHAKEMADIALEIAQWEKKLEIAKQFQNNVLSGEKLGTPTNTAASKIPNSAPMTQITSEVTGIEKIGDAWVQTTEKANDYKNTVDHYTYNPSEVITPIRDTAADVDRAKSAILDYEGTVNGMFTSLSEKWGTAKQIIEQPLTTVNIEQIINDWSSVKSEMEKKPLEDKIPVPDDVDYFGPVKNQYDSLYDTVTDPLDVKVTLLQSAWSKVMDKLHELANMVISPTVTPQVSSSSASEKNFLGGRVGFARFFGGGRLGGDNGYSSTRDNKLVLARKGEWFVNNEAGDYWGKDFMKGIVRPFSQSGRVIAEVLSRNEKVSRSGYQVRAAQAQIAGSNAVMSALQAFGTVQINMGGRSATVLADTQNAQTVMDMLYDMEKYKS